MERGNIENLLFRVAKDPEYRARLQSNPIGTLADVGVTITEDDLPPDGIHLPSNEEILANLGQLAEELSPDLRTAGLDIFDL